MDGRDLPVTLNITAVKNGVVECKITFENGMFTSCKVQFPRGLTIDDVLIDNADITVPTTEEKAVSKSA